MMTPTIDRPDRSDQDGPSGNILGVPNQGM